MVAFLSDLKPAALDSLNNSNTGPKSILYSLAIEHIEIRDSKNILLERFDNNPGSPDYPKFQQAMYVLIETGLSTEVTMEKQPLSAPMDVESLNQNMRALVSAYALPGVVIMPADTKVKGKPAFQLFRVNQEVRMCIQRQKNDQLINSEFTEAAFCASNVGGIANRAVAIKPKAQIHDGKVTDNPDNKKTLIIKLRSTRNIFDFLGQLVNLQNGPDAKIIRVKNSDIFQYKAEDITAPMTEENSAPLFLVEKNKNTSNPITSVDYRGNTYSIPSEKNGATNMVMVILSEILTLNKVPGSIPVSPAVLIK
jgi:hypothetical protein